MGSTRSPKRGCHHGKPHVRNGHKYFGYRKRISLFDMETWAYVYVDKYNTVVNSTKWISELPEEYESMKMREKTWMEVSFGYFVLLSNEDMTPAGLLEDYFGRTDIESVIKTGKEYVNLLPLCKWNETTISEKMLLDIIDLNIYLMLRKKMSGAGGLPGQEQGETRLRLQRLPRGHQHGKSCHQGNGSGPLRWGIYGTQAQHFDLPENCVRVWNQP